MKKKLLIVLLTLAFTNCKTPKETSLLKVDTDFSAATDDSGLTDLTRYITPENEHTAMEAEVKAAIKDYNRYQTRLNQYKSKSSPIFRPNIPEGPKDYELIAIMHYTSSAYSDLNKALRKIGDTKPKDFEAVIKAASSGLNKIKSEPCTAYRGTNLPASVYDQLREGAHYFDGSFLSSSYEANAAFQGSHELIITSNDCKKVDAISVYSEEKEVLWVPGADFMVTALEERMHNGTKSIKMIYLVHRYLDKNQKLQSQKISWTKSADKQQASFNITNRTFVGTIYDPDGTAIDQKAKITFAPEGKGALTLPATGKNGPTHKLDFTWTQRGQLIETSASNRSTKTYYYIFTDSKIGQLRARDSEELDRAKEVVNYYYAE